MAFLGGLVTVVGLLATAAALDTFTSNAHNLQECAPLIVQEVKLKPTITHVPLRDLHWVGADDQTVYAITAGLTTDKGGLWRSTDGGVHFESLTEKLAGNSTTFGVLSMYAHKSNPNNILILGTGTSYWLSNNKGDTVTKLPYPGGVLGAYIRDLRFNPRNDTLLLMHVKRASCKVMNQAHHECPRDLMLNKDVFNPTSKWLNLTENSKGALAGFVDFDWAAALCPGDDCPDLKHIPDELILATGYARAEDYDQPWDKDVSFVASADYFATTTTRLRCGNQLEVVGRSVYMAVANSCPDPLDGSPLPGAGDSITLFTSMDGGNTFTRACLPAALKQDGYELVETHDSRGALVIVESSVDTGMMMPLYYSSVYAAGPHHALFSLSLTNVYQGMMGATTDFTRLEGVSGIYVANQVVPYPSSDGTTGSTDSTGGDMPMHGDMDPSMMDYYMPADYFDLGDLVGEPLIETRITYSAGGRWQRIRVDPKQIRHPTCNGTGPLPWFLHLNGQSAMNGLGVSLPNVYSNPSAPGLVIATGNVASLGSGLDQSSPGVCTWLSRDGGVTWQDVAEGAFIYEFADWGGVVVMAKYPGMRRFTAEGLAKEVIFSVDYGSCWQSVPLEIPLYVDNIRIEPDGQRPVVIVHGEAPKDAALNLTGREGLMYTLNVAELTGLPVCNAITEFEKWSPPLASNGTGMRCVLGQQLQLTRRKQSSKCFYGPDYKRPPAELGAKCPCNKMMDMECDYGYVRSNDSCVPLPSKSMPQCPVVDRGTYTVSSSGLRLVHGDVCTETTPIIPDTDGSGTRKPSSTGGGRTSSSGSGWVGALVTVLVLVVVSGCGWAWWRFKATEEQQETVQEVAGSVGAAIASVWGLLVDKIRSIRKGSSEGFHGSGGEEMGYFQPLGDPGYDVEGRGNIFTLK